MGTACLVGAGAFFAGVGAFLAGVGAGVVGAGTFLAGVGAAFFGDVVIFPRLAWFAGFSFVAAADVVIAAEGTTWLPGTRPEAQAVLTATAVTVAAVTPMSHPLYRFGSDLEVLVAASGASKLVPRAVEGACSSMLRYSSVHPSASM
ncbi:hypothetical protein ASG74_14385 [Knoellia sp. Soil729]|nr:hypothetical protein ASG74_14385 [Knoellia sp. Soil729]